MNTNMVNLMVVVGLCCFVLSCVPNRATRNDVSTAETRKQDPSANSLSVHETYRSDAKNAADIGIQEFSGEGFTLQHPQDVRIRRYPRLLDSEVYSFTYQGKEILSLCVGNWPGADFHGLALLSASGSGTIDGLPYKRIRTPYMDGVSRVQVLIKFTDDRSWPVYLHFRYKNVGPDVEQMAEKIIQSVRSQETGSMPNPSLYSSDPTKFLRLLIQFEERSLERLREFRGTSVNPFPGKQGDPKENLESEIRQAEEEIKKMKAMLEKQEESEKASEGKKAVSTQKRRVPGTLY